MGTKTADPAAFANGQRLTFVVLATTDLHANLRSYNYYLDAEGGDPGLARVASVVRKLRAEAGNCLLLDNGDTLQGSPLGDLAAEGGLGRPHPMIAAMNALGYDAATLGNHDFNYGLDFLQEMLADAAFPVVLANLDRADGESLLPRSCVLTRVFTAEDGTPQTLRIGILGVVPPQITQWDARLLTGHVQTHPIVASARAEAAELHDRGADLVIALCHSGVGAEVDTPDLENAVLPLAASGAVDAIIAGHSHKTLPAPDQPGRVHGVPVVQPGFFGSHLGQIRFDLIHDGRWRVATSEVRLHRGDQAPPDPVLQDLSADSHAATLAHVRRPLGATDVPLETYFSLAGDGPALTLIAQASAAAARHQLDGHPLAHLPLLSAVAPFKAGGRAGPGYYTDIPAGPLSIRHVADLYGFPNGLHVLRVTGADLRDWLDRAASAFHRIEPGRDGQSLLDPDCAGYNFDVIHGLTYRIDVTAPARYSADGAQTFPGEGRIRDLCHMGRPLDDGDEFLVVTNSYRAAGGGHFAAAARSETVLASPDTVRDVLTRHITQASPLTPQTDDTWRFVPVPGTSVIYETGPGALRHKARMEVLGLTPLDRTDAGFLRCALPL